MSTDNNNSSRITNKIHSVTGIVLAGGKSSRFGENKALVEIDGIPLIEHIIHRLEKVFHQVILVVNSPMEYAYLRKPIFTDIIKDLGPIGGIYTGLKAIEDNAGFFVACDMPFLNERLIRHIVESSDDFDAVVPKIDWMMEPLHSLYKKRCLSVFESLIYSGKYQIMQLFEKINVLFIGEEEIRTYDPKGVAFVNINSQKELKNVLASKKE